MLAPSIFGMNDLFDDFGDVFEFSPAFRKQVAATRNISSDIKELAKKINDVYGHKAGDYALRLVGAMLTECMENAVVCACADREKALKNTI